MDVLEKYNQFRKEHIPAGMKATPDIEVCHTLADQGKALVYKKSDELKYGGKTYKRGDLVPVGKGKFDAKMIEQGYFCSPEAYAGGQYLNTRNDYDRNTLTPLRVKVQGVRGDKARAAARVAVLEAELIDAKHTLDRHNNILRQAERDLDKALDNQPKPPVKE